MIRTPHVERRAPWRLLAPLVTAVVVSVVLSTGLPVTAGAATGTVPTPPTTGPTAGGATGLPTPPIDLAACPWLAWAMAAGVPPATLAEQVVNRMTLPEKLGEIVLNTSGNYENVNAGVPRLCIPSLTLDDGPWGLAFGDTGVTQLPVPLAIGATFDTSLALEYGDVLGAEARGQGIDVSQGPNLNIDRVPTSGRADESYGEDPLLTAQLGLADIQGLQARGVMADAKHLVAYSQETNRGALDAVVPNRALQEIYLPPFKAAVTQGHVATLMCAYPQLDGNFQCQDPALGLVLHQWGFAGFVRSDLGAVHDQPLSLASGVQLQKPSGVEELTDLMASHRLAQSTVDNDVERVLTQMFAYGVIGRPATGAPGTPVDVPSHAAYALTAAERSAVLLKDQSALLPLHPDTVGSVAVVGADASTHPVTQGFGSSHVVAPFTSTPLDAISARLGTGTTVRYVEGGSTTRHLSTVPTRYLTPASGRGHGLTLSVSPLAGGPPITAIDPLASASFQPAPSAVPPDRHRVRTNPPAERPERVPTQDVDATRLADLDPTAAGATRIQVPANWTGSQVSWTGTLTLPRSGRYVFSLAGTGAAALTLDGRPAVVDEVTHDTGTWSGSFVVKAHHHYRLSMQWTPPADATSLDVPSIIDLGMAYVGDAISQAVAAAKASKVAVVFAADYSAETFDRPNLSLPGDQDALIAAVAAANPHTVVVLNTGGPVVMPWLSKVGAVVEAWYPGEQDGAAIAAVLAGDVNPSGHLPVTFPTSMAKSAVPTRSQWPGVGHTSTYSEGLQVGYRFNHATGTKPLFPFGFGLSYTTFSYRHATVVRSSSGYAVSVTVTNTGRQVGTDAAQAYLTFPKAAGEPPGQLAAFATVTLAPGVSRVVTLTVPDAQLRTFRPTGWTTVPGTYRIGVGDSSATQPTRVSVRVG
ncbi:MAG TPA: glycoside hydrolase family 3 C-terminal domain-containing protein [Acidimicrobiales bacterium]